MPTEREKRSRPRGPGTPVDLPAPKGELSASFSHRTHATMAMVAVSAVLLFTGLAYRHVQDSAQAGALAQAQTYAALLATAKDGHLADIADDLRARRDELYAVGIVTPEGHLSAVRPERRTLRSALQAGLAHPQQAVNTTIALGDEHQFVWSVTVPLQPTNLAASQWVAVLLPREPVLMRLLGVLACVALAMLGFAALGAALLSSWFNRRVVGALRELTRLTEPDEPMGAWARSASVCAWHETHAVGRSFRSLYERTRAAERQLSEVKRTTREQLRACEVGFERQLQRVKDQTLVDPLTGLRNRRFLETELERLVAQLRCEEREFSLVMIDVDNFKTHNDTFGHSAGDELLRFIGDLLRGALRSNDAAIRYGGDEFMLLLSDVDAQQSVLITERITHLFQQYTRRFDSAKPPTLSAGVVAGSRASRCDFAGLMGRADAALYAAKHRGKNAVVAAPAA